ncbi:chaperonin-like RbcX protein 2, chloroplastic [Ziziphus jujuba]|uniref:Chaperonin-like RbcX protein 2, chloroplastic n=1 Tax=Ziziphus jujuba TaxID=326968 RepID=A0ABM3ZZB2_ZIZJJ|nr:chaperonin-like RbcX protein 2, chloroplastic [Ziziphus jujuba]
MNLKSGGDLVLQRNYNSSMGKKHIVKPAGSLELSSSFIDFGHDRRLSVKALPRIANRSLRNRRLKIVNGFAGQYEDSFDDVKTFTGAKSRVKHNLRRLYRLIFAACQVHWTINHIA